MKKLIINNRNYGNVSIHSHNNLTNTHTWTVCDGKVAISIKDENIIAVQKTAYSYKVKIDAGTVYGYQIMQVENDGTLIPFGSVYTREADAIRAAGKLKSRPIKIWDGEVYIGEININKEYIVCPVIL